MYVKPFIFGLVSILAIITISSYQFANASIQVDPYTDYLSPSPNVYVPYQLSQNNTSVTVNSLDGSLVFNKNSCSVAFYDSTNTNGSPAIPFDSYTVLAEQNGTSTWNPVSIINNAACSTTVSNSSSTVTVLQTKSVTGAGVFILNYTKAINKPFKLTFSATNNNPAWTNYHLGIRENLGVPQIVTLGNQTYDLSQHNNTGLNHNWIATHNAQLIHFTPTTYYNMGIGWNHANSITDIYSGGQARLQIDYTYNTPIISPGQTITIDPSIATDTIGTATTWSASTNATQTLTITVSSQPNNILVVGIANGKGVSGDASIKSVKIGSSSFTNATQSYSVISGTALSSSLWYYVNPPIGTYHITITPTNTAIANYGGADAYSLYNVNSTSPIGVTNSTSVPTATTPILLNLKPTKTNSWLIDSLSAVDTSGSPSGNGNRAQAWANSGSATSGIAESASQYYTTPTINSKNAMSWSGWGPTPQGAISVGIELKANGNAPSQPIITKVNTLNSTAINATFNKPTGTTWSWLNFTLSGGATTDINTTNTFVLLNNYSAGSKYTFSLVAANSTGKSSSSITKYNYTYNVAPTAPVISSITTSGARLSWTNPGASANLTGGFKFYKATPKTGTYSLAGTSSNSTNHFDLSGLLGNQQYIAKISTRYAVGVNYSGSSANSTTVSFYTLPNAPTGLTASQSSALMAHLSWTVPTDNGTVSGYFVEQSSNGGTTWTTLSANTGNTTTTYDKLESSSGNYKFRVSTIKYAGTSSPSNIASLTVWNGLLISIFKADNVTLGSGSIYQSNSTSHNNIFSAPSGTVTIQSLFNNQNFTFKDSSTLFITKKNYNVNATSPNTLRIITYDFYVDCASDGTGTDFEWFTNGTNNHIIQSFSSPVCYTNNTVKWKVYWQANGNSIQNDTSTVRIQVLNNTFGANPTKLTANGTTVTTAYAAPWIISNAFTVGNGNTNEAIYFSANMALNPAYIPINYTAGNLNVTGSNNNIQPIQITSSTVGSNTVVTFTYPTTYTLGVTANMILENKTASFSGLSRTTVDAAHVLSSITFKNATSNDIIKIKAFDTKSNNNANYSLSMNSGSIPILTQIANFRNGTYGTHGQFGSIDLIVLIVLIFSMIGLNRVSETVGLIFNVIVIGGFSFYGILPFDKTIYAGIAMLALVIVGSTKKLPWS
jgi:Fibronectin type III domain